jgi:hypothetical protein
MIKKISASLLLLLIIGCGRAQQRENADGLKFNSAGLPGWNDTAAVSEKERIIIYNAYFTIESDDPEKTAKDISAIAPLFGGYVVSTGTTEVVIRVTADKLEAAIAEVEKTGAVSSKKIFSEDVTDAFRDTELRLDSKLKARDRYLELLKKAENVNAALAVEKELERLNGEIEEMKGRLKRLSHLARYSTITVSLEEKIKPGPLGYIFIGTWKVVKWMFIRN